MYSLISLPLVWASLLLSLQWQHLPSTRRTPGASTITSSPAPPCLALMPVVQLLMSRLPTNWSPAAIKSALMTAAQIMDPKKHEDLEFAYGSGHLNPEQAVDPGLVYDASEADYIDFLCKQGYNSSDLALITGDNSSTCSSTEMGRGWNLNYPSFSLAVEDGQAIDASFKRTVTNVGSANSTYTLSLHMPSYVTVSVEPSVLSFSAVLEKKSFTMTVKGSPIAQQPIVSGAIVWKDGYHTVRSPLVIYSILPGSTYSSFSTPDKKPSFKGSTIYHKNRILGRS